MSWPSRRQACADSTAAVAAAAIAPRRTSPITCAPWLQKKFLCDRALTSARSGDEDSLAGETTVVSDGGTERWCFIRHVSSHVL